MLQTTSQIKLTLVNKSSLVMVNKLVWLATLLSSESDLYKMLQTRSQIKLSLVNKSHVLN